MAEATTTLGGLGAGTRLAIRYKGFTVFLVMAFLVGAYTSFLTADIYAFYLELSGYKIWTGNAYSQYLKFACIVLCFLLTLLIGRDGHDRRDRTLLQTALGLTVVADFLIGIRGQFQAGIAVFFLVQLAFIARHSRGLELNKKEISSFALIFGAVGGLFSQLVPLLAESGLLLAGGAYVLVLTTSVWIGIGTVWRKFYPRTLDWFIVVGIVSFFLCDLNVGLNASLAETRDTTATPELSELLLNPQTGRVATLEDPLSGRAEIRTWDQHRWAHLFGCFIWYWYLPAQTLISLSGYRLPFLRSIFPVIPDLPEPEEDPS